MNFWHNKEFDTKFWIKNLSWTNNFVSDNISIIEENYKKFPTRNRWNCNCHVIHDDDYDTDNITHINYSFLRNEYIKLTKHFLEENSINRDFVLGDIWYNYYKFDQFQEPHVHESTFTIVHYLLYDESIHSQTKFTNTNIVMPKIKQGDVVIFPGFYEHYVEKNISNLPRLTIALGITLKKYETT